MAGMLEYKCPCCDGAIQFDSATQKMKCPYARRITFVLGQTVEKQHDP